MGEVLNNTLHGPDGTTPDDASLAASARTGTLTIADNARAQYSDEVEVAGRATIRVATGHHRQGAASAEGAATPRLEFTPPGSVWAARFYHWLPDLREAGHGLDEHRWLARLGGDHGLIVRVQSNGGVQYRLKPNDLAAPVIGFSDAFGGIPAPGQIVRVEARYDGSDLAIDLYSPPHSTTAVGGYVFEGVALSGGVYLSGFRYRDGVLLQRGDHDSQLSGTPVADRQNQLLVWDPSALPEHGADGDYGEETEEWVEAFQTAFGLDPIDGIIGPETGAALDLMVAEAQSDPVPDPLWLSHLAVLDDAEFVGPEIRDVSATAVVLASGDAGQAKTAMVEAWAAAEVSARAVVEPDIPFGFPFKIVTEIDVPGHSWVDISGDVRDTDPITIRRGRSDWGSRADAARLTLKLNNRHGRYSPRNPASPYYGLLKRNTPIRVYVVGEEGLPVYRFAGEVAEWPLVWDLSGNDVWVNLEAAGPLRRMNRGTRRVRDALRRYIARHDPVAYWPIDTGSDVRVIPSAVEDGFDMGVLAVAGSSGSLGFRATQMDWGAGQLEPWLTPVARTSEERGVISGRVRAPGSAAVAWAVDVVRSGKGGEGMDRLNVHTTTPETSQSQEWRLRFNPTSSNDGPDLRLFVRDYEDDEPSGAFEELGVAAEPGLYLEQPRTVRLEVREDGSAADWWLWIDGQLMDSGTTGAVGAPKPVNLVEYSWTPPGDDGSAASVGHIAVWDLARTVPAPHSLELRRAMDGHTGERAGNRIRRLAEEERVAVEAIGDLEDTPVMGPQYADAVLDLMRECEEVDDGVLHEARDRPALLYRTGRSRYNQTISSEGAA